MYPQLIKTHLNSVIITLKKLYI